ncbi:hypothetical protein [Streptomyces niveus]|uniref:hypothetical protein n=1 Tax=Streptomyces niveus TaxID=193462 RepID=UPI0003C578F5|nr:hypothetical protein [Streptomyces niveus]EST22788.1 hypothetical protein M877_28845 [Streptomyces niveus NCIMB 11891]
MPPFRPTVPMSELRDKLTPEQREQHATTYQASRGGHFKPVAKPVPGTPKK